jgi:hypothetical protein
MPYSVGEKGSYGCSGYPVIKDDDKSVMGCHDTAASAQSQIAAINMSEAEQPEKRKKLGSGLGNPEPASNSISVLDPSYEEKEIVANDNGMSVKNPEEWPVSKAAPCWDGYTQRGMKPGDNGRMVPNCVPVSKADASLTEGDFVMARTTEGMIVGQVEHIMIEGGTYGEPGNPYAVESTPENPAVAIRILEEDDGVYYYTPYSIGALMSDVERINMPNISMEDYEDDDEYMDKAEGYSPPAGARSAARRAIKFKEDGKATGAGTAVGWTRARQLANGETLSLSTVKRMYSYFSRHEVDKKGKDWANQSNPSNGYIMWLAWGGDAGYSWSRRIAESAKNKALFSNFGKDWTTSRGLPELFR